MVQDMRMQASPDKLRAFANSLGRLTMMSALGLVSASAITNAIRNGGFPADWFDVAERLAAKAGVECPREFFSFKAAQ